MLHKKESKITRAKIFRMDSARLTQEIRSANHTEEAMMVE
jgi:hypothetical protein